MEEEFKVSILFFFFFFKIWWHFFFSRFHSCLSNSDAKIRNQFLSIFLKSKQLHMTILYMQNFVLDKESFLSEDMQIEKRRTQIQN